MNIIFQSFISIFIVSLISLIGAFTLSFSSVRLKKILIFLVSFSAGALLGDVFFHLLPEIIAEKNNLPPSSALIFISGILAFFLLEKIVNWRHCHDVECSEHSGKILAVMNLVGDGFHNFLDGLIIAGSFISGVPLGFSTALAVALHEIPQEIGDFGVLLHSGLSAKKALFLNFLSALLAIFGGLSAFFLSSRLADFSSLILPFTAGGFIYIALADLIPELHKEKSAGKSLLQLFSIILGIATLSSLLLFE